MEPGQLDDLDEEVAKMRIALENDSTLGFVGDLIDAAQCLMEEANLFLEFISDQTGWKRLHNPGGEDDDEACE